MVMRPALTPDELSQLNFDRIIRRTTCQSLPLSYFKRATELLGEDSFPLKSKSALRLYIDSDFKSETVPEPYYFYLIWQKHFLGWIDIYILTVRRDQSNSIQWTFPAIQHETLQQRGRNSSIVVRMPPALDPNAKLPNAESKRKHSTEAANVRT